jgi:diguanylate cyclase (GGDEF)-like protein
VRCAPQPPRWVLPVQTLIGACLLGSVAFEALRASWDLSSFAVILGLAVLSDLLGVESDSALKLSPTSIAVVLAAVILGPAPAALIGAGTAVAGWFRWRERWHYLRLNLITYAGVPFVTSLAFHGVVAAARMSPAQPEFYALTALVYLVAVLLNVAVGVGYQSLLKSASPWGGIRRMIGLIAASELFCATLTAGITWLALTVGIMALVLIAIALVGYEHVTAQLIISRERGERLRRQAITDELTGLVNRFEFVARTKAALERAERSKQVAVMVMDLNDFKQVNDVLGHQVGDQLLQGVAQRLREALGGAGSLARLSGDEFALLIEDYGERGDLVALARQVGAALERPFDLGELSPEVSASIGIARAPDDGADAHTLLKRAEVAMYAAKGGSAHVEFYRRKDDRHSARRLTLSGDLRRGIARGELFVEYQPEVSVSSEQLNAVEALARWAHPSLGPIPPGEFIALAEQSGLIRSLTEHVLDLALEQLRASRAAGLEHRLAVNLSARLLSDRRLPGQIVAQLRNASIAPELLLLEITETMVLRDPARARITLRELHAAGIGISMDDFGTGYSSLAYLRELPIDELKVDRSFVSRMQLDPTDAVIVRSVIDLGRSLSLRTVAEGVEDLATLRRLRALGCDAAQGYHISRPLPAQGLLEWALAQQAPLHRLADARASGP